MCGAAVRQASSGLESQLAGSRSPSAALSGGRFGTAGVLCAWWTLVWTGSREHLWQRVGVPGIELVELAVSYAWLLYPVVLLPPFAVGSNGFVVLPCPLSHRRVISVVRSAAVRRADPEPSRRLPVTTLGAPDSTEV